MFKEKYGPWALLVGGSEGVGGAMARKLAERGLDLVLVARKPEPLAKVAAEARERGAQVLTLSADISRPIEALAAIRALTDDKEIGLMIYMAGANLGRGEFVDLKLDMVRAVIAMNVIGQTEFTHHYGGLMKARGKERMTSSIIQRALKRNDPVMGKVMKRAQYFLGLAVAGVVNLLDPECVVIGGGIAERLGESYVAPIRKTAYENFLRRHDAERVKIVPGTLGDNAGPLGAVVLARKRLQK